MRGRGGNWLEGITAVVLNADGEGDGAERRGNVGWVRGIHGDDLVRARVIRGTSGDAEQILVCHSKMRLFRDGMGILIGLAGKKTGSDESCTL